MIFIQLECYLFWVVNPVVTKHPNCFSRNGYSRSLFNR